MIHLPISVTLNTSTYVAITLPAGQSCQKLKCWVSDGTAVLVAIDTSGTGTVTTLADLYFDIDQAHGKGETVCYVKASAGTPKFNAFVVK